MQAAALDEVVEAPDHCLLLKQRHVRRIEELGMRYSVHGA